MKKSVVAFFAVAIIAVCSCFVVNSENVDETKIHGHTHAESVSHWQCNICGMQAWTTRPSDLGCEVSRNGYHSWSRIYPGGNQSVYWQCINCGWQTWTNSIPNEFGCPKGVGSAGRHIWKRLN